MDLKKVFVAVIFILAGIVTTSLFWKQPIFLSCLLPVLAFLKHLCAPIKKELLWFFLTGILGTATESLVMFLGNNPWSYAEPFFLNFPLWLPFLWGLAGTIFVTLREGILKRQ